MIMFLLLQAGGGVTRTLWLASQPNKDGALRKVLQKWDSLLIPELKPALLNVVAYHLSF